MKFIEVAKTLVNLEHIISIRLLREAFGPCPFVVELISYDKEIWYSYYDTEKKQLEDYSRIYNFLESSHNNAILALYGE